MLKPFKIKVESEEHSREIQEWLFSLGYKWMGGGTDPKSLTAPFLFLKKDEGDEELTIKYGFWSGYFEESTLPEKWFYDGELHDKPKDQLLTFRDIIQARQSHAKHIRGT